MKPQNDLLSATGTTIFTVMSALALEHGAINLGQGFPDYDGPEDVLKADADEDGVGGDDAADALRYLVATKPRTVCVRKLRGF